MYFLHMLNHLFVTVCKNDVIKALTMNDIHNTPSSASISIFYVYILSYCHIA